MSALDFDAGEMLRGIDRLQGFAEAGRLPAPVWTSRSRGASDPELLGWLERDTWRLESLFSERRMAREVAVCECVAGDIYEQRMASPANGAYGLSASREPFLAVLARARQLCEPQRFADVALINPAREVPQAAGTARSLGETITNGHAAHGTNLRDARVAELMAVLDGPARERVQRIASLFNPVPKHGDK